MIYVIGGALKSGKTLIAKSLSKLFNIPYFSLDYLMMGISNGLPSFDLDPLENDLLIAEKLESIIFSMLKAMIENKSNYIIEGVQISVTLAQRLLKLFPDEVKICFIGYAYANEDLKLKYILKHSDPENSWLLMDKLYCIKEVKQGIKNSKVIMNLCNLYNIRYFDISKKYDMIYKKILDFLNN